MRFDQVEQSQNNKSVNFAKDLEKKYQKAMIEINRKICDWYKRFAINNKISISEAKKLLNSGKSISEAAEESGFNDYANFMRTFKKVVGVSPKKYSVK